MLHLLTLAKNGFKSAFDWLYKLLFKEQLSKLIFAANAPLRYLLRMPTDLLLVYCTCPDSASAETISRQLVERGAAACVNTIPGVSSTYLWQGKIETSKEIQLLIKSSNKQYPELERIIVSLHPYELPEIVAVSLDRGLPDYLHWVKQCTEKPT